MVCLLNSNDHRDSDRTITEPPQLPLPSGGDPAQGHSKKYPYQTGKDKSPAMRPDMAKVIVERPRYGSRSPSRKKGYRKYVSFDNAVQGHVLAHIYDYVHLHVDVIDSGTVYRMPRRSLHDRLTVNAMYICPRTGILKVVRAKRARGPGNRISFGGLTQYQFRDNAWWEVEVRNSEDASPDRWDVWLERPLAKITDAQLIVSYGGKLFATSKRLLTRRESRQLYRRIRRNPREL